MKLYIYMARTCVALILSTLLIKCAAPLDDLDAANATSMFEGFADSTQVSQTLESLTFDRIIFLMEELEFEAESDAHHEVEIEREYEPPVLINLLDTTTFEALFGQVAAGPYEELELRLKSPDQNENPILEIEGLLTDSLEQSVPFMIQLTHEFDIRLEEEHDQAIIYFDLGYLQKVEIPQRFGTLLSEIPSFMWEHAEISMDGKLYITSEQNRDLFQALTRAIGEDLRIRKRY